MHFAFKQAITKQRRPLCALLTALCITTAMPVKAETENTIIVPVNRSSLIVMPTPMAEVMVANPDIADVHAHNATNLTVVGKHLGSTNVRVFDKNGKLLRAFEVTVSYDLPAIRRSLKNFLPDEVIGVEMVNTGVALTGQVSSAAAIEKALKVAKQFVGGEEDSAKNEGASGAAGASSSSGKSDAVPKILNFMQVTSGQQVMLRVRVGEIQRTALKALGIDLNAISRASGTGLVALGSGGTLGSIIGSSIPPVVNPGNLVVPNQPSAVTYQGALLGRWQPNGPGGNGVSGLLKALEQDGLFKLLAEPNLVAISGEEAEFLAGGEIPIPIPQGGGINGTTTVTVEYKPYGVAVKFKPFVLGENRISMEVQPEVSELDEANAVNINGFLVPALTTRRAKTKVELAPGESFMIAGLISDQMKSNINQLPGIKELPILGALFRDTEFQRNETELVIAVTPYIVDPLKGSDVKLPTDNFRPASQMEMFFYGALGSLSGNAAVISQSPGLEGPIGFLVD